MGIASCFPQSMAGLALATSNNGTVRNGGALDLRKVEPGTLQVMFHSAITTTSVVATFTMQVCDDADPSTGTWYDVRLSNNAATVNTAAGTGSNVDTYSAEAAVMGHSSAKWFRANCTLSGAATNAADKTECTYKWLRWGALARA